MASDEGMTAGELPDDVWLQPPLSRIVRDLLLGLPMLWTFVMDPEVGGAHGIGRLQKLRLAVRFHRNRRNLQTLSRWVEHLELAAAILRVPPSVPGVVVECGAYLGGSTVNLSLACALAGRRLVVCDSFQGLPEPAEYDREHREVHGAHVDVYYEGRFNAPIDIVKENITRWGAIDVCDFVVGFYSESLRDFDRDVVAGFLDVDLIDSLRPCVTALWPRLAPGGRLYVHEARSLSLVSLFFDGDWWRSELHADPPGFVGAGSGLPLTLAGSDLGYAQAP